MTTERPDRGARALARATFLYRTSSNVPLPADFWERQSKAMQAPFLVEADAILANGAVFLPDAAELERLRRIEARWAKWIVADALIRDHACAECRPGGPMVLEGFQCVYHEAASVLHPEPEGSAQG